MIPDLEAAVDYYGKLFAVTPHKRRPGYANFAIEQPPLKLVLFENPNAEEHLNHIGVEVFDDQDLSATGERLAAHGILGKNREGFCLLPRRAGQGVDPRTGTTWPGSGNRNTDDMTDEGRIQGERLGRVAHRTNWGERQLTPSLSDWQDTISALRRYAAKRVAPAAVDEIVSTVLLRVVEQGAALDGLNNPLAWMRRVANNAIIDSYRRHEVEQARACGTRRGTGHRIFGAPGDRRRHRTTPRNSRVVCCPWSSPCHLATPLL